jgi:hypothetical protein
MIYIYTLQLEEGKYYVGKTSNPNFRIEHHFQCGGALWTEKYKPLNVLEIISDCDDYDEDKYTRRYMDKDVSFYYHRNLHWPSQKSSKDVYFFRQSCYSFW